ncbi:MAG TPA: hypothetical protein VJ691_02755 [Vicinamibacterales bacterium]|nr:hypothetical protein [Vicinamibacterales bacterium]
MKRLVIIALITGACSSQPAEPAAPSRARPNDTQHAGITSPHGDHSPHHGGIVLMQGELHYEVVIDPNGRHSVWFSDAVREDLPASVASKVEMTVIRPNVPPESLALAIDESGESWITAGKPVTGSNVMVKLTFVARGEPLEIEIPYVPATMK